MALQSVGGPSSPHKVMYVLRAISSVGRPHSPPLFLFAGAAANLPR
ncbi:hypothetical protein EJ110_NYTH30161 [Nymphaea thermarum]|nr:hypothetical protein EJ110_NYTH30161 [Nymphaea thermarum]